MPNFFSNIGTKLTTAGSAIGDAIAKNPTKTKVAMITAITATVAAVTEVYLVNFAAKTPSESEMQNAIFNNPGVINATASLTAILGEAAANATITALVSGIIATVPSAINESMSSFAKDISIRIGALGGAMFLGALGWAGIDHLQAERQADSAAARLNP